MKKRIGLILDPAHGKDVQGKSSPNGIHKEYLWSRQRLAAIFKEMVDNTSIKVHSPFLYEENEPGLVERVKYYNNVICPVYDETIMISLHNDAENKKTCNDGGWGNTNGIAFWTSRGETKADKIATDLFKHCRKFMPDEDFRKALWLGKGEKEKDIDYESDFFILAGNDNIKPLYHGVLIEWLFMTNLADLNKLMSPEKNKVCERALFSALKSIVKNYKY